MVFYFLITAVTIALAGLMDPGMAGVPAASHHPAAARFRRAFPDVAPSTSCA